MIQIIIPLKCDISDGATSVMSTSHKVLFPVVRNDNNVHFQEIIMFNNTAEITEIKNRGTEIEELIFSQLTLIHVFVSW